MHPNLCQARKLAITPVRLAAAARGVVPLPSRRPPAPHRRSLLAAAATAPDGADPYASNLGQLSRIAKAEAPAFEVDPYQRQRVSPESFANRGFAVDGGTATVNVVLLLLLFALAFERILGLDKALNAALRRWKESRQEERRNQVYDARQALERQWGDGGDGGGGGSGGAADSLGGGGGNDGPGGRGPPGKL